MKHRSNMRWSCPTQQSIERAPHTYACATYLRFPYAHHTRTNKPERRFGAILRVKLTHIMLFLASELANKAGITILWAREKTRAWVPGRGIMGMTHGCHLGFRTNRVLFVFVSFNFSLCRQRSVNGLL